MFFILDIFLILKMYFLVQRCTMQSLYLVLFFENKRQIFMLEEMPQFYRKFPFSPNLLFDT